MFIEPDRRLPGFESVDFYHPLFAYESFLSLLNMVALVMVLRLARNRLEPGCLFIIYLLNYSAIRFGLEFLRLDVSLVLGVNINQLIMCFTGLVAGVLMFRRCRQVKKL
jgi:phosphatidylglycerol:prolipoprotein diacylglycerol transferase